MINIRRSCSKYAVQGALEVGATKIVWGIENILKALFCILCNSPARRDNYARDGGLKYFHLGMLVSFVLL